MTTHATSEDNQTELLKRMATVQIEEIVRKSVALNMIRDKAADMTRRGVTIMGRLKADRFADASLNAIAAALPPLDKLRLKNLH